MYLQLNARMAGRQPKRGIRRGGISLISEPEIEWDVEGDLERLEEDEEEPMYRVIVHNDDVTPMDFVVIILQRIFQLQPLEAEHVMIVAHYTGLAYVCTLPLAEANKRVGKAHFAAQLEGYPLTFTIEPE
jgi:ATP-dependent Clp protease adaptor protein ClpS